MATTLEILWLFYFPKDMLDCLRQLYIDFGCEYRTWLMVLRYDIHMGDLEI